MNGQMIGGIFLIIGTSIGGGMLGLPMAAAAGGFFPAVVLLFGCWIVMTMGALLVLEVNLWVPVGCNLVTMAKQTLGHTGQWVTWVIYLLLLYVLLSAYTAGGADVFHGLFLQSFQMDLPQWLSACLFTIIFAAIVMAGIRVVDYVNRGLMSTKFLFLFLLILLALPFVKINDLAMAYPKLILPATAVMITSFGYATIVPSLRAYLKDDIKTLRKVILIGSVIPLISYIFWIAAIQGTIPREGEHGTLAIQQAALPVTELTRIFSYQLKSVWVTTAIKIFTTLSVLTAFLTVSLGLSDFLADGMKIKKHGKQAVLVFLVTFLPPLLIVIFFPKVFLKALNYGGILCVILLALLPAIMAWSGRYIKKKESRYQLMGGKIVLFFFMILCLIIISYTLFN